jgi:excisionase family DNA binding protein
MSITSTGDSAAERRLRRQRRGRAGNRTVGYTVDEVAEMLRVGRNAAYDLVARGEIPSVKVGRLLRIPVRPFHDKFGDVLPD